MTVTDLDLHRGFVGVGPEGKAAEQMAAFLDGADRVPAVQAIRAVMRSSLLNHEAPQADFALLDAACGTGTETRLLAAALRGQRVIGLDHNQGLLEIAAARTHELATAGENAEPAMIDWVCADIRMTGLADDSVAAARVERGLIYVANGDAAISEFARVLAPGGLLVAYELDYGGFLLPLGNASPDLMHALNAVMESSLPSPWAGRRLAKWMADAELTDISVTPMNITAGPVVADRIVGDTIRTAVAEDRLHPDALDWLDTVALEPPSLPAITVVGYVATAVKPKR